MSRREAVNTNFYSLWFALTGNRTQKTSATLRSTLAKILNLPLAIIIQQAKRNLMLFLYRKCVKESFDKLFIIFDIVRK